MKTKRRAWVVAGVVVLLAIGISMPFWKPAWISMAYHDTGFNFGTTPALRDFMVLTKRYEWLPGHVLHLPDQVCPHCVERTHAECFDLTSEYTNGKRIIMVKENRGNSIEHGAFWIPKSYTCTCPDPSHKDKP